MEAVACSAAGAPVPENIEGNPVLRLVAEASIAVFRGIPSGSGGEPLRLQELCLPYEEVHMNEVDQRDEHLVEQEVEVALGVAALV